MKLALIRRQFAATGGAELYVQRLIRALADRGHEVHLFAENWTGHDERVRFRPVSVRGPRAFRPVHFADAVSLLTAREKFDCVFSLDRTLKQDVYRAGDGVHRVWLQRRREFAPLWKQPFIGRGAFHRHMQLLEAQTFNPANTGHIIVNSDMVRNEILEHFHFPEDRIHLVRNGVDVARFQSGQRKPTRARFNVKDDECLLLFVGSGWERKGLQFVLNGMAGSPAGLKLLVVGKGRKPAKVPDNVIFADAMTKVEDAYAAADVFITLPIYEPCANVVSEALAAGLPVITTSHNGASELVRNGIDGEIVTDPTADRVVRHDIAVWRALCKEPRKPVDTAALTLERNANETLAILERAAR